MGCKATSTIGSKATTVDFPFETSIPTEFIINPPEIMIWHTAFYSTPVQSPEWHARIGIPTEQPAQIECCEWERRLTDSFADVLVHGIICQTIPFYSNNFSIEMEKDAAGYRAFNLNYYCRRWYHLNKSNYHYNFYLCNIFDLFSCDSYY